MTIMKLPLKVKATLLIVIVGVMIGISAVILYDKGITDLTTEDYEARSLDIAEAMAVIVDPEQVKALRDAILEIYHAEDEIILSDQWGTPEFDAYISDYSEIENSEEFLSLREQLRRVQDVIDVDCLYITWFDIPEERYIYLVDAAYEDACPPGCVDPLFIEADLLNIEEGSPPLVTHTPEYGYLVTVGMPIRTADGELVGHAGVDLSMNEIVSHKQHLRLVSVLVFGIVTALACMIGFVAVDRTIVRPINKLSETAQKYTSDELKFSEIDIHTGDEIEALADSMKRMERDIKEYYDNLLATRNDLETAREHVEVLNREASIDSLTGLRNKRAYDLAVADLERVKRPYAIVMIDLNDLKGINDRYGHEKGDIAIRNLAGLICNVFKHSPVFRIGGDEFVVILTNEDLESREGLIGRFRDEVRRSAGNGSLQPWERTSAACGCAVYDAQTDRDAASVFKRADEDMYEHKAKMKNASSSAR